MNDLPNLPKDAALSQTAGVHEPGRYFAGGPQGHFFADDLQLARDLVNLYDKDDDWTITDLRNPTGAAPAASGAHPDALPDGTLSKSTAKRVEALASASVSERARELLAAEYRSHGWHEDAGRLCMGGDPTSFVEDDALRVIDRLIEQGDEDAHVITELGRLLACIAVILKGPEPAGTAWSYHDLPELVASALSEPRQVAAEMKAWARTRMAEQQSSRRDRMMFSEWAKRLLPESSFPIKDFDVEGMSITKEAAREAVKRVAIEQALTQQRGERFADDIRAFGACFMLDGQRVDPERIFYITPQPSADAVRELVKRWRECAKSAANGPMFDGASEYAVAGTYIDCADELESLLSDASGEKGVG